MIALLAGASVLSLAWSLWCLYWYRTQAQTIRERMQSGLKLPEPPKDLLSRLRQAVNGLAATKGLERQLAQANIPLSAADFYMLQIGTALLLGVLFSRFFAMAFPAGLSLGLVVTAVGSKLLLRMRRGSLAQAVTLQLPDGVRMLANALHAGLSVRQGLSMVAREMPGPLGPFMQRTVHEIQLGSSLEEALDGLSKRVDSPDLQFVVTTILLQHEVGGDLAGALESVAAALVERLGVEGEVRTVTAEQRYVAMVLPVVPIAGVAFLNAGHPGYAKVLVTPGGLILLLVSGLLQGIGFFFIFRAARIKV